MPSMFTDIRQFFAALRHRKVIQVGVVYAVVAWILIQIGEATFESLRLPDWSQTLVVVLALLGFPIALVLAWAFEITPDGVKRDPGDLATAENDDVSDGRPSVAVLPFVDMSEEKDQDYFCEGVAEEILNSLARIDGFQVASRTSSFRFKGHSIDIRQIGSQGRIPSRSRRASARPRSPP